MNVAIACNENLRMIFRGIDLIDYSTADIYSMNSQSVNNPEYLYNDSIFDDYKYLLNKTVLIDSCVVIGKTILYGPERFDFDAYSSWKKPCGKLIVLNEFDRPELKPQASSLNQDDYNNIRMFIEYHLIDMAVENPDIQFYYFLTPKSILTWDALSREGKIERLLEVEKYVFELLLQYDNIHIFSFNGEQDIICDLDNYSDIAHYSADINSQMLVWMSNGHDEITKTNYVEFCEQEREFFLNYNYETIYQ